LLTGFGNDMVKIGFLKLFADGSLGAHTAALKESYSDKPEAKGLLVYSQKKLDQLVLRAHRAGLQLGIHAIGDLAVESVLEAFSRALRKVPCKDHRHRIEHCSVLSPLLVGWMKRLGVVASVQPHFVVSDFWVVDRVGEKRSKWVYPFKTLMREGVVVVSGSDCPVEPLSPLFGVWAAVARKSFPEERLSVEEALMTYTVNAAFASFDERNKGSVEVGKFADFTVVSGDLFEVEPDDIKDLCVEMTIVGGKVVYASENFREYC